MDTKLLEKKMESALRKEEQLVKRDQEYDRRMKDIDALKAKNEEIKQIFKLRLGSILKRENLYGDRM